MQTRFSAKAERVECVGGWSFLLLVLGIFCLLPGTIVTGIYVQESIPAYRLVALIMFCVALTLVMLGIFLCVYWCTRSSTAFQQANHKHPANADATRLRPEVSQSNANLATAEDGLGESQGQPDTSLVRHDSLVEEREQEMNQ